ncbi:hypothetical protein GCM10025734_41980 [Kitasatospora paranensis]|uniref:hypothetical protein n=1 Tax=Kitasatospora paranensis TaxID=258053 RepID=UPI0031EC42B7
MPRRRARHRYAWTGAAAFLLTAVAVPAIGAVQPFPFTGGPAAGDADAYHGSTAAPPVPGSPEGHRTTPHPALPGGAGTGAPADSATPSGSPDTGASPVVVAVPDCVRGDLGRAEAHLDAADAAGHVYGSFTVRNTSARRCGVTGAGTLGLTAANGADPARLRVADHTAGDPATALPAPAPTTAPLVIGPGEGYRVRFGWVPDGTCPSEQSGGKAPSAAAGAGAGAGQGTADPAPGAADPSPSPTTTPSAAPPAVTIVHTPQAGAPAAASAVVSGSCAGTVYRAAPETVPVEPATPAPTPG